MQKSSMEVIPLQVGYGWPIGAWRAQSFPFEAMPLGCSIQLWHHHPGISFLGIQLHFGDCQNPYETCCFRTNFAVQCCMSDAVLPIQSVLQCRHVFPAYLVSIFFEEMKQSRSFRHAHKEFLKRIITLLSLLSTKVKWWNKLGMVNMYHHAVMVKRDKLILHLLRWTKLMDR